MAWPFKKGKVMDFTSGKIPIPKNMPSQATGGDVDLTTDVGGLGFLGAVASSSDSSQSSNLGLGLGEKHLKAKVEDIEYKQDSLSRQISKILDRLDLAEKKIDRNEGYSGS